MADVLEAPTHELMKVEGVGVRAAALIHLALQLSRRYAIGGQQLEQERTEEGLGLAVRLPFDTK